MTLGPSVGGLNLLLRLLRLRAPEPEVADLVVAAGPAAAHAHAKKLPQPSCSRRFHEKMILCFPLLRVCRKMGPIRSDVGRALETRPTR